MAGNTPSPWVLALLGGQLALGLGFAAAELGELPHYHDSNAYFELARVLAVDSYRGIAYPGFLAFADWLGGSPSMLAVIDNEHPGAPCTAPDGIALVQALQLVLCALSVVYWLRTREVTASTATPAAALGWTGTLAVAALLSFDPLISHFSLSVMPDALAMAASLVFCGALARVAVRSHSPTRDGAVLFAAFTVASLLRPEKKYVLLCVAGASALVWWWIGRRRLYRFERLPVRLGLAAGLVALALAASMTTERLVHSDYGRPSHGQVMLHARVIFPHLADVFEALPADVKSRFSDSDVAFYDRHVLNPGPVMQRVSDGDGALAARLAAEMARTAWRERGAAIAFDTAKDALENAVPTFGFYPRVAAFEALGIEGYRRLSRSDMLPWTHERMTEHHPGLAHASLAASGLVFAVLSVSLVARSRRLGAESAAAALVPWLPAVAFALANGAAFALHADAVSPRYTLTTHAMALGLVYASALVPRDR